MKSNFSKCLVIFITIIGIFCTNVARNRANRVKKSICTLLKSGYSSVPQNQKKEMPLDIKNQRALDARRGLILAILGETDPTNGAEFWDGTDFLAWGLKFWRIN